MELSTDVSSLKRPRGLKYESPSTVRALHAPHGYTGYAARSSASDRPFVRGNKDALTSALLQATGRVVTGLPWHPHGASGQGTCVMLPASLTSMLHPSSTAPGVRRRLLRARLCLQNDEMAQRLHAAECHARDCQAHSSRALSELDVQKRAAEQWQTQYNAIVAEHRSHVAQALPAEQAHISTILKLEDELAEARSVQVCSAALLTSRC